MPLKVLQTAVTDPNRLELIQSQLPQEIYNYSLILYFLEFDATVKSGQRVFDIYLNDEKKHENFDILANGSNYKELAFHLAGNGSLNLTFVKVSNGFNLGPICNALEILQVRPWVQPTDQSDGKFHLNLQVSNFLCKLKSFPYDDPRFPFCLM